MTLMLGRTRQTVLTLAIACIGAALAWLAGAPVYILLGPAFAVSVAGVAGLRTGIDPHFRDLCFVVIGLAVGAGFDRDALGAMIRWPLAFAMVVVLTWATMMACRALLARRFGYGRRAALLASAPGHLSFVIAMAEEAGDDVARISITQSVRLVMLTLAVPFIAMGFGVDMAGSLAPPGPAWSVRTVAVLFVVAVAVGRVFMRLRVPAPLLLGAMITAGGAQLSGLSSGVMPLWLVLPAYLALGALIGTRFSGVSLRYLRDSIGAGLSITAIAVVFAGLASVPVAMALGMPAAHVLVAFSPGGLETMAAMGVVLGVVPGFVAACHITRLMVLSVLLPMMAGRPDPDPQARLRT
ncbi:AbrB family transcriptional regulator [Sulfitobacter sp. S190]|uniref:AbrB family transcriptional regulator n=1 Tax=Sulfitobacter sp. S190 TaxID=2867022 RepID=UPI0021A62453|nr:AbrB family transcriptional regulator [Sulfitobacter sp. S190]UWR23821.1 AbrB family transcriptional regulator [Sulfitobacter sp. S190]